MMQARTLTTCELLKQLGTTYCAHVSTQQQDGLIYFPFLMLIGSMGAVLLLHLSDLSILIQIFIQISWSALLI